MTFGCQKENLNEQDPNTGHQQGGNTLFRKGKLSEFSHVKDFITEIKNKNGAKQTVDIQYRTGLETENDFIILENQDIAIHSGDEFNTYTIPIIKYQQPQGTFSNLVVQFSVASDSTNAYILTYEPNAGYLDAYALDDRTPFSGQVSYESLDYDGSLNAINTNYRMVCNSLSVTYCKNGEYGGIGSTHAAGPSCIVASNIWTETYTICYETDDGFGSRSETIEPPEGSGGGGGGSSSSPNTGNSTSTIPADLVSEVIGILSLNISNHQQEIAWLESFTNFPDVISMY